MIVEWTRPAISDLIAIPRYIARPSRSLDECEEAVERLATFPASGRPGRKPDTRELVISNTSYVVVYGVRSGVVHILHVLHSAQQPR
jgi:toxin ParE1/3/4